MQRPETQRPHRQWLVLFLLLFLLLLSPRVLLSARAAR